MTHEIPTFTHSVRPGTGFWTGHWMVEIVGRDGKRYNEPFRTRSEGEAKSLAAMRVAQLTLQVAEFGDHRVKGHTLLDKPDVTAGLSGDEYEPWIKALDAVECFGDRPSDVANERKRHARGKLSLSPWLRTPNRPREWAWLRSLAKAFPAHPWPASLFDS